MRLNRFSQGALTLAAALILAGPLVAIPVEVESGATLKVTSLGETLFEALPLDAASVSKLTDWLENPPAGARASAEGEQIKGLPVVLTVSSEIASRWKSEPKILARLFAERLNSALAKKSPTWSADGGQVVPLTESRTVSLKPFPAGLTVSSTDPSVVKLEDLGQGSFRLTGLKWGRAALRVESADGLTVPELPVSVKPWAARWDEKPDSFSFWGGATPQRVERTFRRWLTARALVGAKVELSRVADKENPHVYVAKATEQGAIAVEKKFTLTVKESPPQTLRPASLVVLSNHPERIVSDGVLFDRKVSQTPFRFMWHHRNDPEGPNRHLAILLTNTTGSARRLRVLWYGYGPSPDEIHVGHTAALDYSSAGLQGMGEEIVLPANGSRTIEIRFVKPGQTVSGMAYVDDLGSGGPLEVTVVATSGTDLPTNPATVKDPGRTASGVFAGGIETDASHLLGGPFTYIDFGGEPYEKDADHGHPSYGNFGTVYRTRLTLKNPSTTAKPAYLGFASGGGAARGVLALDGELFDLPMGVTGNGLPLKTLTLEPGEVRQIDVELFPQAGSNYPVRLVVRSDFERREKEEIPPLRPLRPSIP